MPGGLGAAAIAEPAPVDPGPPVAVHLGTRNIAPFVIQQGDRRTGFSMDLWHEISVRANITTVSTQTSPDVAELLNAVSRKEVDVGIAAISMTPEREARLDFSQSMFSAGLGIAVPRSTADEGDVHGGRSLISRVLSAVFSREFLELAFWILFLTLIPAHVIFFIERRGSHGMLTRTSYIHGIGEAYLWSITALASQAETSPKTRMGRGVAVLWMYFSVIFIAFFTAGVTSNLTSQKLLGSIEGPEDLAGVRVVTVTGSTAADFLGEEKIPAKEFPEIASAYAEVRTGKADAVVYDMPVLQYLAADEGGRMRIVGETFHPESYGIALPSASPLRERIDIALLEIRADGTYDRLLAAWFGTSAS